MFLYPKMVLFSIIVGSLILAVVQDILPLTLNTFLAMLGLVIFFILLRDLSKTFFSNGQGKIMLDNLKVNCYSGHTYAERPRYFLWQDADYEVEQILKSWQEPGERCFQVRTKDGGLFGLSYNEAEKQWSLMKSGGLDKCQQE